MDMVEIVAKALEAAIVKRGMWDDNGDGTVLVEAIVSPNELACAAIEALPLQSWLEKMESDWGFHHAEWGVSSDPTLDQEVAAGKAPEIAQLRELVAALAPHNPE